MRDGVRINVKEMVTFSKKLGDTKLLERIYNNAFEDMLNELEALSKKNHEFTSRSFSLENHVTNEINGKKGSVYVPISAVKYADFVYSGTDPHEINSKGNYSLSDGASFFGKKVLHPGYKGDPFILNSWYKFKDKLTKDFLNTFVAQYKIALRAV